MLLERSADSHRRTHNHDQSWLSFQVSRPKNRYFDRAGRWEDSPGKESRSASIMITPLKCYRWEGSTQRYARFWKTETFLKHCTRSFEGALWGWSEDIQHCWGSVAREVKERIPGAAHQPHKHPHGPESENVLAEKWPEHGQTRSPKGKRTNIQAEAAIFQKKGREFASS